MVARGHCGDRTVVREGEIEQIQFHRTQLLVVIIVVVRRVGRRRRRCRIGKLCKGRSSNSYNGAGRRVQAFSYTNTSSVSRRGVFCGVLRFPSGGKRLWKIKSDLFD